MKSCGIMGRCIIIKTITDENISDITQIKVFTKCKGYVLKSLTADAKLKVTLDKITMVGNTWDNVL